MAKNYTDLWLNYSPVQSEDAGFFKKISKKTKNNLFLWNSFQYTGNWGSAKTYGI